MSEYIEHRYFKKFYKVWIKLNTVKKKWADRIDSILKSFI